VNFYDFVRHEFSIYACASVGLIFLSWRWQISKRPTSFGTLYPVYTIQQTSSKFPANVEQLARVFWIHLLDVCWIV